MTAEPSFICTRCGYLWFAAPVRAGAGSDDPHRRLHDSSSSALGRCLACDERAWADPRLEATALALRGAGDRTVAVVSSTGIDRGSIVLGAGSLVLLLLYLASLGWTASRGLLAPLAAGLAVAGALAVTWGAARMLRLRPTRVLRPLAARWHLALPTATPMRGEATGTIEARDALLHAPLTQRACVAYELGLRANDELDAADSTWLLLEQRSVRFTIGGRGFPADAVRLQLSRVRVDPAQLPAAQLQEVLRARAMILDAAPLVVTETVVLPGPGFVVTPGEVAIEGGTRSMPCLRRGDDHRRR